MPRTGIKDKDGISIEMFNLKSAFHPGDVIGGRVVLKSAYETPIHVSVELFGRSKTKYIKEESHGKHIYRGRAPLLRVGAVLEANGDSNDGQPSWLFSLPIPPHVLELPKNPRKTSPYKSGGVYYRTAGPGFRQDEDVEWEEDAIFWSNKDNLTRQAPPSICYFKDEVSSGKIESYVEYALVATATLSTISAKTELPDKWIATFPVLLRNPSTEQPIENLGLRSMGYRFWNKSSDLRKFEEGGQEKPSFGKRLSLKLKSSTPKYCFRVWVYCPRIVQLDHPEFLPLKVWMMPILDPEWTSVEKERAPSLSLTAAKVDLKCTLRLRFNESGGFVEKDLIYPLTGKTALAEAQVLQPIWAKEASQPIPKDRGPHANSPPGTKIPSDAVPPEGACDLGAYFHIGVHSEGATLQGQNSAREIWAHPLTPTFKTYNISVSYSLKIQLDLKCVGKEYTIQHEQPVTVLGTSEVQMRGREEELGEEGMRRNYDDLAVNGGEILSQINDILGQFLGY
jgi:hypothetical protein